jgi:predicted phosphodiesterase
MRYAILSDIHSNLEALEAVIDDLAGQEVETVLCLGDVVGYGADPNECARRIRGLVSHIVAGNHDLAAVGQTDVSYFNPHAKRAIAWTAQKLEPDSIRYLSELPYTVRIENVLLVHATPSEPAAWNYLLSLPAARAEFEAFTESICFIGHSHQPLFFSTNGHSRILKTDRLECSGTERYIINVGSVGQPRDGDPRSCYAIFDSQTGTVELRRVVYDTRVAQKKILQAGLPPVLAVRLARGE